MMGVPFPWLSFSGTTAFASSFGAATAAMGTRPNAFVNGFVFVFALATLAYLLAAEEVPQVALHGTAGRGAGGGGHE